ncbi:MAG: TolC family protein [Gemmatimonadetes bacterium]|nr:TolC family protein [Gemmatimonadota bacterium]
MSSATNGREQFDTVQSRRNRSPVFAGRLNVAWAVATLLAATLGAAAANATALSAQEMQRDPGVRVLTLQEALTLATEHNPQYRQAINRLELLGARSRQAWAAFLPTVSARYSTGQNFQRQTSYRDFEGRPTESSNPTWVGSSDAFAGLNLSYDIFDGGRRLRDRERIHAEVRVSRLNARVELDGILAQVQNRFLSVLREKARVALESELLADRESDLQFTERRFELALDRRPDLLAREFDVEQQRAALREVEGRVEITLLNLRVAIGDPSLVSLDVAETLPEPFDPASLDIESLVARTLAENPTLRAQEAQVQISRAQLRADQTQWWPRISASTNWGRSSYETGNAAIFDLRPGNSTSGTANWSFSFSIPVFDGFQRSYGTASRRIDLRNANESLRQAEMQLELDIRTRYASLTTTWATLQQRERALEIASERLQIMQEEYQLATVDIQPLRSAIAEEATQRRDLIDQRYAFALALLDLYQTVGIVGEELGIETVPGGN